MSRSVREFEDLCPGERKCGGWESVSLWKMEASVKDSVFLKKGEET